MPRSSSDVSPKANAVILPCTRASPHHMACSRPGQSTKASNAQFSCVVTPICQIVFSRSSLHVNDPAPSRSSSGKAA